MFKTNLFEKTPIHEITQTEGIFSVLEYTKDISVNPSAAQTAYFASQMNIRKRQVIAQLSEGKGVVTQAGAMQLMLGDVTAVTNIKNAGDFIKKFVGSQVTGESTVKPLYTGTGTLVLEPTYKYILLVNLADWNGSMVIEDGMFLACDETIGMSVVSRANISSALLGNEGLFNLALSGDGIVVLESPAPAEELMVIDLENDVVKIDGSMAIAWSKTLDFTVEKTTKTLVGSAATGEGFVNVYKGTGRILVAPTA